MTNLLDEAERRFENLERRSGFLAGLFLLCFAVPLAALFLVLCTLLVTTLEELSILVIPGVFTVLGIVLWRAGDSE